MRRIVVTAGGFIGLLLGAAVHGEYLGTYGPTYPIAERDLIELMQAKAQAMVDSGEWEEQKKRMKERTEAYLERPPGTELPRATERFSFLYDPSVTIPYAIRDIDGNEIYPAGTTVNPLDYIDFERTMVLFDGDDERQCRWVRHLVGDRPGRFVLIMTAGPYLELMEKWRMRLYLDQYGHWVEKFGIEHVPATVAQDGRMLRVTEIALGHGADRQETTP